MASFAHDFSTAAYVTFAERPLYIAHSMIKIYINERPLLLTTTEAAQAYQPSRTVIVAPYLNRIKFLYHYLDNLEKGGGIERVVLHHRDPQSIMDDLMEAVRVEYAAGGVLLNEDDQVLMIYKNHHWDLPKGHIEKGESAEEAAIREVNEETGVKNITLGKPLHTTFHLFRIKRKRVLKISHWYAMRAPKVALTPQTEEGIERAEWLSMDAALVAHPTYHNIKDVIEIADQAGVTA